MLNVTGFYIPIDIRLSYQLNLILWWWSDKALKTAGTIQACLMVTAHI